MFLMYEMASEFRSGLEDVLGCILSWQDGEALEPRDVVAVPFWELLKAALDGALSKLRCLSP